MEFDFHLPVVLVALIFEAAFGYPGWIYRRLGHPVTWVGYLIELLDKTGNMASMPESRRRLNGVLAAIAIVMITAATVAVLQRLILDGLEVVTAILVTGLIAGSLLSQRSLFAHVRAVADGLDQGLPEARSAVSEIAGRDTNTLDEAGCARAAVESLAENFSDGIVAPVFWGALFGLPGMAIYKAINTADSMIGHQNERYKSFGWATAKLDDLVNFPGARLAAFWIVIAAYLSPSANGQAAWTTAFRDAGEHRSPNAGWPEAAMAGALGLQLAGPRTYDGETVDDAWMGSGDPSLGADEIRRALRLYQNACTLQVVAIAGLAVLILLNA